MATLSSSNLTLADWAKDLTQTVEFQSLQTTITKQRNPDDCVFKKVIYLLVNV